MHGFRILERRRLPCGEESPPVAVDEDGIPVGYWCTEPVGHRGDHVARLDGAELHRWATSPYPVV